MRATIFTIALTAASIAGLGAASAQGMHMHHGMSGSSMSGSSMRGSTGMEREMSGSRMQTMERSTTRTTRTREPVATGSTNRRTMSNGPGASEFAPGQVKKQRNMQSARDLAPGRSNRSAPGQMMQNR